MKFVFSFKVCDNIGKNVHKSVLKWDTYRCALLAFLTFFFFAKFRTFVNMKIFLSKTNSRKRHYGILELVHFK
jgi:hypothetical protein